MQTCVLWKASIIPLPFEAVKTGLYYRQAGGSARSPPSLAYPPEQRLRPETDFSPEGRGAKVEKQDQTRRGKKSLSLPPGAY